MNKLTLFACAVMACVSCSDPRNTYEIIPYPNSLEARRGSFDARGAVVECDPAFDEPTQKIIGDLSLRLANTAGEAADGVRRPIKFTYSPDMAHEAYSLEIAPECIDISASGLNGVVYAVQSLKQLMPVYVYGEERYDGDWSVPCVKIDDAPRFSYRGMHLDVARHFFDIETVKRYLDIMAVHKLNTLHWHLTDDQGWRIEIKRYPELALKGGFRNGTVIGKDWESSDNIPYGGYYTQQQIREVVGYAAGLGITIVPEIDLPGHMLAALKAYPALGCTGGPYEVWQRWGVADEVLCAGNDRIYEFIENVLLEVMELFPSEYIHIGGDECPKVRWEKCPKCQARIKELGLKDTGEFSAEHYLQSYVMTRVEKFLTAHGRRIIGWDEILEGELSPRATVMSWRGSEGGIQAAKMGRDVIMTPKTHFYFDYYQTEDPANEPFGIGGYVPVEHVYSFDASLRDKLTPAQAAHIIGIQANMWTEYIKTPEHLEYMLLPRLAALSEVQWCNDTVKNRDRFMGSLRHMCDIYSQMGYNFATHIFDITGTRRVNADKSCVELTLSTQGQAPIYYTLDGTDPTTASKRYTSPIEIRRGCTVKAMVARPGMKTHIYTKTFADSKSLGKPATLNTSPREKYLFTGATLLTDGIYGPYSYSSGEWLGYQQEPMDVTVKMGKTEPYSSVTCNMMIQMSDDIFPPKSITVYTSEDGREFTLAGSIEAPEAQTTDRNRIENYTVNFPATSAPYVRIVAEIIPEIPAWHPAHGRKAFIFVDEIAVN